MASPRALSQADFSASSSRMAKRQIVLKDGLKVFDDVFSSDDYAASNSVGMSLTGQPKSSKPVFPDVYVVDEDTAEGTNS